MWLCAGRDTRIDLISYKWAVVLHYYTEGVNVIFYTQKFFFEIFPGKKL